jgi:hypothetical protein
VQSSDSLSLELKYEFSSMSPCERLLLRRARLTSLILTQAIAQPFLHAEKEQEMQDQTIVQTPWQTQRHMPSL